MHAVSYGMNPHTAGFFAFSSAYEVDGGPGEARVRVIARYGDKDLLVSGWLEGEATIAGRPAAVEVGVGAGRVVLLGFRVQHRGQSHATFRLLFNAIFTADPPVPNPLRTRGRTAERRGQISITESPGHRNR